MKYSIVRFCFLNLFFWSFHALYSQDTPSVKEDVITPAMTTSVQQSPESNINLSTGKILVPINITTVKSRTSSYPISIGYNGAAAFDEGQFLNRYKPSSILGVGWGMSIPQIVADTKFTGTREDDTFYLKGNLNSKMICFKKDEPGAFQTGEAVWEFKTEQFSATIIKYHYFERSLEIVNGVATYVDYPLDYWEIIDDNGVAHYYGKNDNSRESVLAWGNWIGDSNDPTGARKHTMVWNISEIKDQWEDIISFTYDKVERKVANWGPTHTEASYLKEILTSTGEKISFNYLDKLVNEYYQPHIESPEPDAYQERYESRYLYNIQTFDRASQLVYTYQFDYTLKDYNEGNKKRYLSFITQKDKNGVSFPSQEFDYYYDSLGYKGGLKTIKNSYGGSTTYYYENKSIFTNNNSFVASGPSYPELSTRAAMYVSDNYSLRLMYDGPYYQPTGSFPFKITRQVWTGKNWIKTEHKFDEEIQFYSYGANYYLDNARFVFGDDYYAALIFNRGNNKGNLYLSHKMSDGSWSDIKFSNINVESWDDDHKEEDPVLINGNDFVAIGTNRSGRLHKYLWNGTNWLSNETFFNQGQYYYAATNNYILILDEDATQNDYVTGHRYGNNDYYYIMYLDSEKKWQIKSWSGMMDSQAFVNGIHDPSFFYPNNAMSSFVADNNPEYFLRWDEKYNLNFVDNVIGEKQDDWPLLPVGNNMYVLNELLLFGNIRPQISYAFNGVSWKSKNTYGQGNGLYLNHVLTFNSNGVPQIDRYNPNTHNWLNSVSLSNPSGRGLFAFSSELFLGKKNIYQLTNNGFNHLGQTSSTNYNDFSLTGGGDYIYSEYKNDITILYADIYRIDKRTGLLITDKVKDNNIQHIDRYDNGKVKGFGGTFPYYSKNTFLGNSEIFKRVIEGKMDQQIFDKVISRIEINDNNGNIIKTTINYNNPFPDTTNSSIVYGEVVSENIGAGSGSLGTIRRYYDTGIEDARLRGLLKEEKIYNNNNQLLKRTEKEYSLMSQGITNSELNPISKSYFIRNSTLLEEHYLNGQKIENMTTFSYNNKGLLESKVYSNSKGEVEEEKTVYAYTLSEYDFLNNKNMVKLPNLTLSKTGGIETSLKKSTWDIENNHIVLKNTISGLKSNRLRIDNKIVSYDNFGNILETSNALGLTKSILMGNDYTNLVASVSNATHQDLLNNLDVSYTALQNLNNTQLELELLKLYDRLPNAQISLSIYDSQGRIIKEFNVRKQATNYYYDTFGRLLKVTDNDGNILQQKEYIFGN